MPCAVMGATRYTYDELNRLTRVEYDDGRAIEYRYDAAGNLVRVAKTGPTSPRFRLPHSGIGPSQCFTAGSNSLVSCSSAGALALNSQQDGMRATVNAPSYSQVGTQPISDCMRDDLTGLIWEVKGVSGVRGSGNTYTNFGDSSPGDASDYVAQINALGLCGFTDWRLPTADELFSIVNFGKATGPLIDAVAFPNTPAGFYWTSTIYRNIAASKFFVLFENGYIAAGDGNGAQNPNQNRRMLVRLVRGAGYN